MKNYKYCKRHWVYYGKDETECPKCKDSFYSLFIVVIENGLDKEEIDIAARNEREAKKIAKEVIDDIYVEMEITSITKTF